ncbi:MAG TPA: hypothetical protein EYH30_10335 [Anaerolineales bacterium]|nr:hypothetical protein [Anaerolineae bacterium]HIQ02500.1 hypothetical protein [Anaerolineales bacterium]
MTTATRIIAAVTWAEIGFLIFVLWRIARFYEHSSGRRAYSYLFLPPLLLLPSGAAYYITFDTDFVGCIPADLLLFLGGILLIIATTLLGQIMVGER